MTTPAELRLSEVTCRHGRRPVVHGASVTVAPGESVAITGANGSGKTTLLRAVLGLHAGVSGCIAVDGVEARTAAARQARRSSTGWIPQRQTHGRFPLLAEELLASSGAAEAAQLGADRLGVGHLRHRPVDTLSGGQLQRMYLARALGSIASGARLLLADEPTAALDFAGQDEVADLLTGLPVTLLVVSHDRTLVERCDRVLEMADGHLRCVR